MKEYRIGEVFEDAENFDPPKRLKCVEIDDSARSACASCAYGTRESCVDFMACYFREREDLENVRFIETTEPIG
jgi:hypothetical protein